jgi:Prokaryotic E2 family C/ThiF family
VALADYFDRTARAASQVLEGLDSERFERQVRSASVGLTFTGAASRNREGSHLLDLVVRLMARLYPSISIDSDDDGAAMRRQLAALARAINPSIAITKNSADVGIAVGACRPKYDTTVFAGARGWDGHVSLSDPQPIADTGNPLGAGAAACIAVANVFRRVFLADWHEALDSDLVFSTYSMSKKRTPSSVPSLDWTISDEAVLVGVGAVGMGALWALGRTPLNGLIHLVDPETLDLSNLQRYVLAERDDVAKTKVELGMRAMGGTLKVLGHPMDWQTFVSTHGYRWSWVLASVDTAQARREIQSSLPRWVANAWTQVGDLGVSVHPRFGGPGACLACLYLPEGPAPNDDEVVAKALGIPDRVAEVRTLLHLAKPVPGPLLAQIEASLGLKPRDLAPFQDQPIRDLYVRGICGGGLLPLGGTNAANQDIHVPLAHQSALAGVLLAARLSREAAGRHRTSTSVARLDVQRRVPEYIEQPSLQRHDGRCICEDTDFVAEYRSKYSKDS